MGVENQTTPIQRLAAEEYMRGWDTKKKLMTMSLMNVWLPGLVNECVMETLGGQYVSFVHRIHFYNQMQHVSRSYVPCTHPVPLVEEIRRPRLSWPLLCRSVEGRRQAWIASVLSTSRTYFCQSVRGVFGGEGVHHLFLR